MNLLALGLIFIVVALETGTAGGASHSQDVPLPPPPPNVYLSLSEAELVAMLPEAARVAFGKARDARAKFKALLDLSEEQLREARARASAGTPSADALARYEALVLAADRRLPPLVLGGVVGAVGLCAGARSGYELGAVQGRMLMTAGGVCAIFVSVSLVGGQVATIRTSWVRIAVRVGGSWIAAVGLLMLGWSLRTP